MGGLPFYGLAGFGGTAVDPAGDVFVASALNNAVFELTAGGIQKTLPFTGLNVPVGIAVDSAGDVFVSSGLGNVQGRRAERRRNRSPKQRLQHGRADIVEGAVPMYVVSSHCGRGVVAIAAAPRHR